MLRPDFVKRVKPPITTIPNTKPEHDNNQIPTDLFTSDECCTACLDIVSFNVCLIADCCNLAVLNNNCLCKGELYLPISRLCILDRYVIFFSALTDIV